ncbi:phosphonate ABC transporter ATP-binding protein [Falsochrobactrum shanghaiense]|uniref:Phosphonate ABC transporter ATP-binding protein n=1 Tax=Falsochrobactrum shanghaiense TaxID=2201899 RepID=A0A316J8G8_9HYPH|nr:ATP-binding cassette domain-containing protein [Falsochrobactrum shanghaiense]PWL17601.1 phosphonate ABC transporter ATP-binding protein [Falsochrobactrum shanghaiense]
MMEIIRARGLTKRYADDRIVFSGIELDISAGQRVALIGSNGAGKSTLLKCLIGLLPLNGGEVNTLGENIGASPSPGQLRRLRRQIGVVFQHHGLVSRQSVLTNVVHGKLGLAGTWRAWHQSIARREWREDAQQALHQVGLCHKSAARADELSGGQAQRVAIARALVRKPQLLIADEPAASLDPVSGHDVMALFSELSHKAGITTLYTTHDMDHALEFSDRIIALKSGSVFFNEPTRNISRDALQEVFHA